MVKIAYQQAKSTLKSEFSTQGDARAYLRQIMLKTPFIFDFAIIKDSKGVPICKFLFTQNGVINIFEICQRAKPNSAKIA